MGREGLQECLESSYQCAQSITEWLRMEGAAGTHLVQQGRVQGLLKQSHLVLVVLQYRDEQQTVSC